MANVRFFRLSNLPNYNPTYRGIFVYLTTPYDDQNTPIVYSLENPNTGQTNGFVEFSGNDSNWASQNVNGSGSATLGSLFGQTLETPSTNPVYDSNDNKYYHCYYDQLSKKGYVYWGTFTTKTALRKGLYFGGQNSWERLTNDEDGFITLQDVIDWVNNNLDGSATIGTQTNVSNGTGVDITINGVVETDGVISATQNPDITFTVGDGALKFKGSGATVVGGNTVTIPDYPQSGSETDIHSANDTADSIITLDKNTLVWDDTTNTISVRTKTQAGPSNLIVTQEDIANLNGAMHLIGAVSQESELPSTSGTWNDGDTWIITARFTTDNDPTTAPGWAANEVYEEGDTLVYLGNGWEHIQGNLTVGVKPRQVTPVSNAQGNTLELSNGESSKLVATDGNGLIKTDIPVDFLDDLVVGLPEIDVQETAEGQDQAPQGSGSNQDLNHEIELTHTYQIGAGDSDVYTHSLIINTPNKSIDIQVPTNASDDPEVVTVDLVWREWID